ncbi:MAG: hypothetical protein WCK98_08230 [bacterium]
MAKTRLVAVEFSPTSPYASLKYGFRTPIKESEGTVLGHTLLNAAAPLQGVVLRVNAPKPPRATKVTAVGYTSSYVSADSIVTAAAAGWQITASKVSGGRRKKTRFTTVVYVTMNGVKYAWNIRNTLLAKITDSLAALGVKRASSTDNDLVFGASFPKPPSVKLFGGSGDSAFTVGTFYDPSNEASISDKYEVKEGKFTQTHWATIAL